MADSPELQTAAPATLPEGFRPATEEISTLNGVSVPPQHIQRVGSVAITVNGTAVDISPATSGRQDTANTSLASVDGKTPALVGGRVPVDGSGVTQPVSGPLTDVQLRASAVPVSGPLTDVQLRASAVPVSMAAVPTGGATSAKQDTQIAGLASIDAGVSATAASVDSIDDKTPALVSGRVPVDGSGVTQPVSGPLTDTQLRAAPVPVSGTVATGGLTDTQLRASAVPVSMAAVPTGAATETTLGTRLSESDFDTKVGALTETAPGSDTASSGLNGRLQRIAQRLTTAIASLATIITNLGSPFQAGGSIANTTFASTVADGANVALGTKTDAKNTATDTTSVSGISIWKQISASVQAIAASVAGTLGISGTVTANAGTNLNTSALLTESDFDTKTGALTETAPASDTASSGVNGRLQRVAQRITSLITAMGSPFQAGGSIGNTTFASTVADAANVTIGAKADAKSTATDTTPITAMSVWKQISASVQALVTALGSPFQAGGSIGNTTFASTVADGANVNQGANADAAVVAGAAGSLSAKLRSISRDLIANIVLAAGANLIGYVGGKNTFAAKVTLTTATNYKSLANGSGWSGGAITTGGARAIRFRIQTKGQASGTNFVDFYLASSINGETTFDDAASATADQAFTAANRLNARYLGSIRMNQTTAVTGSLDSGDVFSLLPGAVVLIAINSSGAALSTTAGDHILDYELVN